MYWRTDPGDPIQPAANKTMTLRAFCSPDNHGLARGNLCDVTTREDPAGPPAERAVTHCSTWPTASRRAAVRCWTPSAKPIRCCGHGLLSCAFLWTRQWGGDGVLETGGSDVNCTRRDGMVRLGFSQLEIAGTGTPDWLGPILGIAPVHCAIAGDEAGYLVAELPEDTDLAGLVPPQPNIAARTLRALIVTCRVSSAKTRKDEHFQYRYFAPQYGVMEDPATGSAMRVLTQYWNECGLRGPVTALQCSAAGGLLTGELLGDATWIGGYVTQVAPGETHRA